MFSLLLLAACFVAFTNGANANFKGVASLYGSGTTSLRVALWWGTATTFAGGVAALFFAQGIAQLFSGKGLVPDALTQSPDFLLAVAIGGAGTSFLATRFSFPVSTTHALIGGLVGAGWAGGDHTVHLGALGKSFLQPLFVSPLLAIVLGAMLTLALLSRPDAPRTRTLDTLHFLSGGAASFARGLNDTPKMAALLILIPSLSETWRMLIIAMMTAIGALADARNVAETLAKKVTGMSPREGFAANLSTAILVSIASYRSLPVSTTHVSVGSLLGNGLVTRKAKWETILQIVLAWFITLPCGAALAALAVVAISAFR